MGALGTLGLFASLIIVSPVSTAAEPVQADGASANVTAVDTANDDITASEVSVLPVQAPDDYTAEASTSDEQATQQQTDLAATLSPDQQEDSNAGVARIDLNSDIAVVGVTWDSGKVAPTRVEIRTLTGEQWSEWKSMGIEDVPDEVDPARNTKGSTDPMTLTNVDSIEVIAYGDADTIINDVTVNVIDPRGAAPVENTLDQSTGDQDGQDGQDGQTDGSSTDPGSADPESDIQPQSGVAPAGTPQDPATVPDQSLDLDGAASSNPAAFRGLAAMALLSADGKTYDTGSNGLVINTRKGWGADESLRGGYLDENITYQGAVIHHTAGSNTYTKEQVPGQIQGIYYYHAVTLDWGDVGYQLLVDKFGGVWEGRYGSLTQTPMGAQAYGANRQTFGISVLGDYSTQAPSAAAQEAVAKAIAWEFNAHGIKSATGKISVPGSLNKGISIDVISGHRDVGGTACPGDAFYARIPAIRTAVAGYMASAQTPVTPPTTPPGSTTGFDPANVISDAAFYSPQVMTEADIQTFLNTAGKDCVAGSGTTCLKNTTFPTVKLTTLRGGCQPLSLTGNQSAARIISEASKACGINPQVILATLQKEQSGITQARSADVWAKAMGSACPDGQPCDPAQGGFEKQVYYGADKLVSYRISPTWEQYLLDSRAGRVSTIANNPDAKCGTQSFVIKNDATASLYMYTPYIGGSTVSGCAAIGVKSFWDIMNRWFPNSLGSNPVITPLIDSTRLAGIDRYATAVEVSQNTFPDPSKVTTVVIATAKDFPDGLSAAPLAAKMGGPLLLTSTTAMPSQTIAEIRRLAPKTILIAGGEDVVTPDVEAALRGLVAPGGTVTRLSGADRYATSLAIARYGWPAGSASAFVATGRDFPDALSAGAAAGKSRSPLILVNGSTNTVPASTMSVVTTLGVKNVYIAGDTGVVSADIAGVLGVGRAVVRYGGLDRYETSAKIAAANNTAGGRTYLASGGDFPDALSGAVAAGYYGAPLLLSPQSCIPRSVEDVRIQIKPSLSFVLGGESVLGEAVRAGRTCS